MQFIAKYFFLVNILDFRVRSSIWINTFSLGRLVLFEGSSLESPCIRVNIVVVVVVVVVVIIIIIIIAILKETADTKVYLMLQHIIINCTW
jgi:hypothetical protein